MKTRGRRGLAAVAAATMVAGVALSALGPAASSSASTSKTTLTVWENYGTEQNATALKNLVTAFEKANPSVKINVVSEPASTTSHC